MNSTFKNFAIGDLVKASGALQTKRLPAPITETFEDGSEVGYHIITGATLDAGAIDFEVNGERYYRAFDLELVAPASQHTLDLAQEYLYEDEDSEDEDDTDENE